MESVSSPSSQRQVKCSHCGCSCSTMNRSLSGTCLRSEDETVVPQNARVEIENECQALRETVTSQQQTIQDLVSELEEERNASSTAANEAMSMILRLQGEKAEIQMEAKQFKRFAEEKMAHDQQESLSLDELLYKREQVIQSLNCEVEAYKHRMMSYGLTEAEAGGTDKNKGMSRNSSSITENNLEAPFELPHYDIYPPLRINVNESEVIMDCNDEAATPGSRVRLKELEGRINRLEKSSSTIQHEKVIVGQSPKRHLRKFSTDSSSSLFMYYSPKYDGSFKKAELSHLDLSSNLRKVDNDASEVGDDMDDRVYMIDSIHEGVSVDPKDSDLVVQKLYARLQALEADRESMRQSIISIGTDKAQMALLKEIAQNLCNDMTREVSVQKPSVVRRFSFISLFKWAICLVSWRRKSRRCKYVFGLSANNAGMLVVLDQGPRVGHWRSIANSIMGSE